MDLIGQLPGFLLGLIGWAATMLVLDSATRLAANDRRAMIVCSWMFWMIPGLGTFVLNGLMTTDTAALFIAVTTMALGMIMLVGAIVHKRRA